jgi:hypothetical protein
VEENPLIEVRNFEKFILFLSAGRRAMNQYPLTISRNPTATHFEYSLVAQLVRVSKEFILQCEREELIKGRVMLHGVKGLCYDDVNRLKMIRFLHEDMGLDLGAVDFVLRYRERLKMMKRQIDEMECRLQQKEMEHQAEILALCRHLQQSDN